MTMHGDLERRLTDLLDERARATAPEHLLRDALDRLDRTRPRPGWRIQERWIPMETRARFGAVPRTAVALAVLGLLLVVFTAISLASGSAPPPKLPPPFGLARNGLIAFDSADGDIHVADADGSDVRVFVDSPNEVRGPAWSPDGSRLAYFEMVETGATRNDDKALVHVLDVDRKNDVDVTRGDPVIPTVYSNGVSSAAWIAWSPDSTRLALSVLAPDADAGPNGTTYPAILVANADGSGVDRFHVPLDAMDPAWSPDGSHLVFKAQERNKDSTTGVWVAGIDGRDLKQVATGPTPTAPLTGEFGFASPTWSPSGDAVVYYMFDDPAGADWDVWLVEVPDGSPRRLLDDSQKEFWPGYSPDGKLVAYQRWPDPLDKPFELHVVTSSGSDDRSLQANAGTDGAGPVLWAPDGSALLTTTVDDLVHLPTIVSVDPAVAPIVIADPGGVHPSTWEGWVGLSWQRLALE